MAKTRIPKKIGGYKLPKAIRKNAMLKALLASDTGRNVIAKAMVAGAGAAAAVLVGERDEVAGATQAGKRKGAKALGIVGDAVRSASDAALEVVREAADNGLSKKLGKGRNENPRKGAAMH